MLFFKSSTRNIASVIYVNDRMALGDGSQSRLIIKSNATELEEVPVVTGGLLNANGNYYADVMEGTFDVNLTHDELYFDFENKKVYKQSELDAMDDYSKVNVIFGRRSSNGELYLFTPTAGSGTVGSTGNYGNGPLYTHLQGRTDTETWRLMRIEHRANYTAANNFETARLNNKAVHGFYGSIGISATWTSHFTQSTERPFVVGDGVYRISNRIPYVNAGNPGSGVVADLYNSPGLYFGVFRVKEFNTATGKLVVEVKYYNSLD